MTMQLQTSARQRGLTRLEAAILLLIIVFLLGSYMRSVRFNQEQSEAVGVRLTIAHIEVGMAQEWVKRLTQGKNRDGVMELVGTNPIRWLEGPPSGYLGELRTPKLERLDRGVWFFDINRKELVYVPRQSHYLEVGPMPVSIKALRWSIKLAQNPESAAPEFGQLTLKPVQPYQWF